MTLSVEQGIMLPANPVVKFLINAALGRAYQHHPIDINHFIVNGTHIHMILTIENPEDLPKFMERFKTESAHYLNRMLGRKKRTIWCKSYDSPALLTKQDVVDRIVYLYTNPVKDGLIESINKYPGISTWENYKFNDGKYYCRRISRDDVFIVDQNGSSNAFKNAYNLLVKATRELVTVNINTDSWMKVFSVQSDTEKKAINTLIDERISEVEKNLQLEIKFFKGRLKLETQGVDLNYMPNRKGRKMWCISSCIETRKKFINFVKALCKEARDAYQKLKDGARDVVFPPGMFAPRLPVICNLLVRI